MSDLFTTGIRPAIDAYLAEQAAKKRDYGEYWSASSAGYCMRLNILKRLQIPCVPEIAEDEARSTRVFEAGHIFHEWVQRITKDAGLSIAQELELQDEDLMIRGHFDDLVLFEGLAALQPGQTVPVQDIKNPVEILEQRHLILYDYKTANSQAFNYKRDEIGHYHKMQLGTYMYMLRNGGVFELDTNKALGFKGGVIGHDGSILSTHTLTEARILQISKDDLRMREQQLMWSPALKRQVEDYWRTLQGYWEKKLLPRCTCLEHDGGFMGKRSKKGKVYNPYFWEDVPCSLDWVLKHKQLMEGWKAER